MTDKIKQVEFKWMVSLYRAVMPHKRNVHMFPPNTFINIKSGTVFLSTPDDKFPNGDIHDCNTDVLSYYKSGRLPQVPPNTQECNFRTNLFHRTDGDTPDDLKDHPPEYYEVPTIMAWSIILVAIIAGGIIGSWMWGWR